MGNDVTLVPNFLKARDAKALRVLCIQKNIRDNKAYKYDSIQFVAGEWYAWFYEDCSDELMNKFVEQAKKDGEK